MKNYKSIIIIFVLIFTLNSCASRQEETSTVESSNQNTLGLGNGYSEIESNYVIYPGVGIGNVKLEYSLEEINQILGNPFFDHSYKFDNCNFRVSKWYVSVPPNTNKGSILEASSSSTGKVVKLLITGENFATADGILTGSLSGTVKEKYSDIESFKYLGSRLPFEYVEGFQTYWIDKNSGIGFEFYKDKFDKKWKVHSISIFRVGLSSGEQFFSIDCPVSEKYWKKLNPFELNSSAD